jgi:hypothetical protein
MEALQQHYADMVQVLTVRQKITGMNEMSQATMESLSSHGLSSFLKRQSPSLMAASMAKSQGDTDEPPDPAADKGYENEAAKGKRGDGKNDAKDAVKGEAESTKPCCMADALVAKVIRFHDGDKFQIQGGESRSTTKTLGSAAGDPAQDVSKPARAISRAQTPRSRQKTQVLQKVEGRLLERNQKYRNLIQGRKESDPSLDFAKAAGWFTGRRSREDHWTLQHRNFTSGTTTVVSGMTATPSRIFGSGEWSGGKSIVERLVKHKSFNMASISLIFAYTIFVGVKANQLAEAAGRGNGEGVRLTLMSVVDYSFDALFILEYILRCCALGRRLFQGEDAFLNSIDTLCILLITVDIIINIAAPGWATGEAGALRVLRLSRVLRLILRAFRFSTALSALKEFRFFSTNMLLMTLRLVLVMWTIVLVLTYITAVTIQVAYGTWLELHHGSEVNEEYKLLWGSLGRTMFTLTASVSGAHDWTPIIDTLFAFGEFYVGFFMTYVVLCIFGVFNIAVAIFVQCMTSALSRDHTHVLQTRLGDDFSNISSAREIMAPHCDEDGTITWDSFSYLKNDARFVSFMHECAVDSTQVDGVFHLMEWGTMRKVHLNNLLWTIVNLERSQQGVDLPTLMTEHQRLMNGFGEFMAYVEAEMEVVKETLWILAKRLKPRKIEADADIGKSFAVPREDSRDTAFSRETFAGAHLTVDTAI